jgi:hypothetical protein
MTLQQRMNLRLDLYFKMSVRQRKMFHSLGYESITFEYISVSELSKITKNKDIIKGLIKLKQSYEFYILKVG